ncbi:MAG: MBL fold metallo-hydrolase [Candidatus Bathyarchaeia archaeon]
MRILFAGTGAAEGWPALFCECDVCMKARALRGKNIRTRSSIHIDEELKVDWPPDTYLHVLQYNLNLAKIKYLFITHSHYDHLHPDDLLMRQAPFAHMRSSNPLNICGSQDVINCILKAVGEPSKIGLILKVLEPFETIKAGSFRIMPLPANHDPKQTCLLYLLESKGNVILYGHDSGWFPEETWRRLESWRLDLVILDCTTGAFSSRGYHMGLKEVIEMRRQMLSKNMADKDTIFVATHFSHNGLLLHEELSSKLISEGIEAAYDGLTIEL